MEIVVYQGKDLDHPSILNMTQDLAASTAMRQEDLHIRVCQTQEELSRAIKEATLRELASTERFFPFKATEGTRLLQLSQVLYFKSSGHRVVAMLANGQELIGRTLRLPTSALLEPLVRTGQFIRIYRSTYVNKLHISSIGPTCVRLDNGMTMSVSHKYYQALWRERQQKGAD